MRALHHLERGAAEERRRELDPDVSVLDIDRTDDAEVDERDDGDLRVGDLLERLPDLLGGHHCAPAGAERRTIVISSHSGASSSVCVPRSTASTSSRPTRATSSPRSSAGQHAERVRPQLLDRRAEARLVAQPLAPHLGVHAVVRLLAVDLRREAGDRRVGVVLQRRDADLVGDLVEPAARDRVRPVEQAQLDERRAAVLVRARGRTRARPASSDEQLVDGARVADLVLRDRGERDVLLEHRRDARPLGVAPAEDELVVSQAQQYLLVHAPPSAVP